MSAGLALEVSGLSVSYGGVAALRRVGFDAAPGEILGVIGPNGAGKSTLIQALLGLVRPDRGSIRFDGAPIAACRPAIAYLPQRSAVDWDFPALVREVVAMGRYPHLRLWQRLKREDRRLIDEALRRVQLEDLADRPIGDLSGGQQRRVFLARALAQQARLLLLDEPFAAVDAVSERLLWSELRRLRDEGRTLIVVDHDLSRVETSFDRLLLLAGEAVAFGPTASVFTRANLERAYGTARLPGAAPDAGRRAG